MLQLPRCHHPQSSCRTVTSHPYKRTAVYWPQPWLAKEQGAGQGGWNICKLHSNVQWMTLFLGAALHEASLVVVRLGAGAAWREKKNTGYRLSTQAGIPWKYDDCGPTITVWWLWLHYCGVMTVAPPLRCSGWAWPIIGWGAGRPSSVFFCKR